MNNTHYILAVNAYMQRNYCLTIEEAGYSVEEWLQRFGDRPVEEAVEIFAEKHNLISTEGMLGQGPYFLTLPSIKP